MSRQPAPVDLPVVLSIAGSDSGGGAGIQADLATIGAGGGFGTTAITNVTAQHTRGVTDTHPVPTAVIEAQIDAVREDFDVAAAKTGMLGTAPVVETVIDHAADLDRLVVDPVMVATSGDRLLDEDAEAAYEELIAQSTLVTPNTDEAAVLTDRAVEDAADARAAGEALVDRGADAALVTGGHLAGERVVDVLVTDESVRTFEHERVADAATHGSGCTLSAAIATRLAHGDDVPTAVGSSVSLLAEAVRYFLDVGEGPGAVHHAVRMRDAAARRETVEGVETLVAAVAAGDERVGGDAAASATAVDASTTGSRHATPDRDAGQTAPDRDDWLPRPAGQVVGATPYAERPGDVASAVGGLARTPEGIRTNRGVGFDGGGRLGAVLLAAREAAPAVRYGVGLATSEAVVGALERVDVPVGGPGRPADASLERRVADALPDAATGPVAVRVDDDLAVLGPDADAVAEAVGALTAALGETEAGGRHATD